MSSMLNSQDSSNLVKKYIENIAEDLKTKDKKNIEKYAKPNSQMMMVCSELRRWSFCSKRKHSELTDASELRNILDLNQIKLILSKNLLIDFSVGGNQMNF